MKKVNEAIARKVLDAVDAGLVRGIGKPKPGSMCVEAAVCYAYGLPHSDRPPCVGAAVRAFKIRLNDARWSNDQARTKGMRALAIAQLGSDEIDQAAFSKIVVEQTIRRVVATTLRAAATRAKEPHKAALLAVAERCANEGTRDAAQEANRVAKAADAAADAYAYVAAAAAAYAASTAASAAHAAAHADAGAAAHAAADANANAAAGASAAAYAAAYTVADSNAAAHAATDNILVIAADIGLQALIALKSPGCEFLYLLEAK